VRRGKAAAVFIGHHTSLFSTTGRFGGRGRTRGRSAQRLCQLFVLLDPL